MFLGWSPISSLYRFRQDHFGTTQNHFKVEIYTEFYKPTLHTVFIESNSDLGGMFIGWSPINAAFQVFDGPPYHSGPLYS